MLTACERQVCQNNRLGTGKRQPEQTASAAPQLADLARRSSDVDVGPIAVQMSEIFVALLQREAACQH